MKREIFAHHLPFCLALTASFVPASSALADRIIFKNGRIEEGIVVGKTDTMVRIQDGPAQITVPLESIREIIPGTPTDHLLLQARDEIADHRVAEAVLHFGQAARQEVNPDALAAVMFVHADSINAIIPQLSAQDREFLRDALKRIQSARMPRQADLLLVRLHWHLLLDDVELVRGLLDDLGRDYPKILENDREQIIGWFGERIDLAIDLGHFSVALDLVVELRRLDKDQAGGKRAEMVLLWARRERDAGRYEEALKIYLDQLLEVSPNIARDRIAVTLSEAEKSARKENQLGRVIELYEKYGMPADPEKSRKKLSELWHELGWISLHDGKIEEARRTFARADLVLAGSAERDLRYCDYFEAKNKLKPEDALAQYKLGEWCAEGGLLEEAHQCFESAMKSEALKANASAQLQRVDDLRAEKELARLMDLYEGGQYVEVVQALADLRRRAMPEGLRKQAEQLDQLTRDAIQISAAEHPQQAEVLMQQAERAYWTGDTQTAYNQLRMLMDRYADTPAGARAHQFFKLILPRLDLNSLEERRHAAGFRTDATPTTETIDSKESPSALAEEIRRLRSSMSKTETSYGGKPAEPAPTAATKP